MPAFEFKFLSLSYSLSVQQTLLNCACILKDLKDHGT